MKCQEDVLAFAFKSVKHDLGLGESIAQVESMAEGFGDFWIRGGMSNFENGEGEGALMGDGGGNDSLSESRNGSL
ncbi:hypothetical protein KDA_46770 [Dictyobacter alpinus]|uniref:Uncharacterized protein n=1 Tax=Dictyobacter alpinus TaxID=2014873 RepID=A0A402BCT2_9CHLR|nr:hypothetical protein [Dictyobacter alpinus]GCE29193.1 hypothetical protein KDA_46770 [Dictyobacter alpinus]